MDTSSNVNPGRTLLPNRPNSLFTMLIFARTRAVNKSDGQQTADHDVCALENGVDLVLSIPSKHALGQVMDGIEYHYARETTSDMHGIFQHGHGEQPTDSPCVVSIICLLRDGIVSLITRRISSPAVTAAQSHTMAELRKRIMGSFLSRHRADKGLCMRFCRGGTN